MTMIDTPGMNPDYADDLNVEEWQSVIAGDIGLATWNNDGVKQPFVVTTGSTFFITPGNRRRIQAAIRTRNGDPFKSGALRMTRAAGVDAESGDLFKALKAMEMTNSEIKELVNSSTENFEQVVSTITQTVTLARIYSATRRAHVGGEKLLFIAARLKSADSTIVLPGDPIAAGLEDPEAGDKEVAEARGATPIPEPSKE